MNQQQKNEGKLSAYLAKISEVNKPEPKSVKLGRPPTRYHPKGAQRTAEGYKLKTITMRIEDVEFMKASAQKREKTIKSVYAEAIALYKKKYGK